MPEIKPICPKCETRPKAHSKSGRRKDYCRECGLIQNHTYNTNHKKEINKYSLDYYRKNKQEMIRKQTIRTRKLKYGLTEERFQEMLKDQNGLCFICNQPNNIKGQGLAVDHDHATGNARSLLCQRCNTILGMVNEDGMLLMKMIYYLDKFKKAEVV